MFFYLKRIFFTFIFLLFQWTSINDFWEAYKKNVVSKNSYVVEALFVEDVEPCQRRQYRSQDAHVLFRNKVYTIDVSCRYFYKKGDRIILIYSDYYDLLANPYQKYRFYLVLAIFVFFLSFSFIPLILEPHKKDETG
jgi:hypothetical protein